MIRITDLWRFFGDKRALGPVSAEIPAGSTVGFLGLNGVGKTTLLRILACDLRPSAGEVVVAGSDVLTDPHSVRARVGYLPERPPLYGDMKVGDYLAFAARIKDVPGDRVAARVAAVEEQTATTHVDGELTRNLSHGYRQRVGIAQALIHEPELLILDEPTNGLDPIQIVEIRDLIDELKGTCTILISSHILTEISQTCDRILVLDAGEIIASGSQDELTAGQHNAHRATVWVRAKGAADGGVEDGIRALLGGVPSVTSVDREGLEDGLLGFAIQSTGDVRAELCRALVEAGHDVVQLERTHRELERLFVELVSGGEAR